MSRLRPPLLALAAGIALMLGSHGPAQAHALAGEGLASGLCHPLLGLDHLLMLVASGTAAALVSPWILAWALGGALLGAVAGSLGLHLHGAEVVAALAIAAAAATALKAQRLPQLTGMVVAGGMAIHGLLHGLEGAGSTGWWLGALVSAVLVSGGSFLLLRAAARPTRQVLALGLGGSGLVLAVAPLALAMAG